MTTEFLAAIEATWPRAEWVISPGCLRAECEHANGDESHSCEPSFSRYACGCCGTTLGGDRETGFAIHREAFGPEAKQPDNKHEISMCTDCVAYHANGTLPAEWAA